MQNLKPKLPKRIFWDVNFDKIDYQKSKRFVIERVFERGDVAEVREIRSFYGDELIKKEITQVQWLSEETVYLCCAIFNLEPKDFLCFILRRSNQQLSAY